MASEAQPNETCAERSGWHLSAEGVPPDVLLLVWSPNWGQPALAKLVECRDGNYHWVGLDLQRLGPSGDEDWAPKWWLRAYVALPEVPDVA